MSAASGPLDLQHALEVARDTARLAGELLRDGHRRSFVVENKGEVDLVTEHDRRSEALCVGRLSAAFPGHAIVGEEGAEVRPGGGAADHTWFVDPLDGTTNFAHGLPLYAVSIGLEIEGEPCLGVVFAPELGWEFTGARGGGVRLNGAPVRVSSTPRLDGSLVATGFPYDRRTAEDNNLRELGRVLVKCQGVRRMGVASLDCAAVACGWLDGYWEFKLEPWDISAGALLVLEAGGRTSDLDGGRYSSRSGRIVASNGLVHEELLSALARGSSLPSGKHP
jgi:myo-inositol-1(or 4)-monophosphatase